VWDTEWLVPYGQGIQTQYERNGAVAHFGGADGALREEGVEETREVGLEVATL
jgi:hypothetical protein